MSLIVALFWCFAKHFDLASVMDSDGFSEEMCRHLFKQILEAVRYLHK